MKLKVGILSFAHMHARSYAAALAAHPNVELLGIADTDSARGSELAEEFGARAFPTVSALLERGMDAVIVTSENVHHRALVAQAAASGVKAILCEKPLATTLEDAESMIAVCRAHNVRLATAFPCRYSPAFQRLRSHVQSGAIGDVLAIRGTNRGSLPGGWFTDKSLSGGGAIIDHTVHVADLNRRLLGKEAVEVYAEAGHGFFHQEWEDTGFLSIRYEGGVFATLDTSWSRPKTYPTWGDVSLEVVGTGGVLMLDMFAQHLVYYNDQTNCVTWPGWGSGIDDGLIVDFLTLAAGQDAPNLATGEDGLRALQVALAAYRSAEAASPVMV